MSDLHVIRAALDMHCAPGDYITSDDLRPALDAAQVPGQQIGPLMGHAARLGWLEPTARWAYSRRRTRKHSRLSVYRVTDSSQWKEVAS